MSNQFSKALLVYDYPNSNIQARERMEGIRKRRENGEQVISPNPCVLTDYFLANKARLYRDNVLRRIIDLFVLVSHS
ncbi:hypothetical protein PHSC3_001342 [Chlamydiales bacterium STE3]|nr:hypothetical protein PHSC3_001342 [Chlamydiales bacterium STE3]